MEISELQLLETLRRTQSRVQGTVVSIPPTLADVVNLGDEVTASLTTSTAGPELVFQPRGKIQAEALPESLKALPPQTELKFRVVDANGTPALKLISVTPPTEIDDLLLKIADQLSDLAQELNLLDVPSNVPVIRASEAHSNFAQIDSRLSEELLNRLSINVLNPSLKSEDLARILSKPFELPVGESAAALRQDYLVFTNANIERAINLGQQNAKVDAAKSETLERAETELTHQRFAVIADQVSAAAKEVRKVTQYKDESGKERAVTELVKTITAELKPLLSSDRISRTESIRRVVDRIDDSLASLKQDNRADDVAAQLAAELKVLSQISRDLNTEHPAERALSDALVKLVRALDDVLIRGDDDQNQQSRVSYRPLPQASFATVNRAENFSVDEPPTIAVLTKFSDLAEKISRIAAANTPERASGLVVSESPVQEEIVRAWRALAEIDLTPELETTVQAQNDKVQARNPALTALLREARSDSNELLLKRTIAQLPTASDERLRKVFEDLEDALSNQMLLKPSVVSRALEQLETLVPSRPVDSSTDSGAPRVAVTSAEVISIKNESPQIQRAIPIVKNLLSVLLSVHQADLGYTLSPSTDGEFTELLAALGDTRKVVDRVLKTDSTLREFLSALQEQSKAFNGSTVESSNREKLRELIQKLFESLTADAPLVIEGKLFSWQQLVAPPVVRILNGAKELMNVAAPRDELARVVNTLQKQLPQILTQSPQDDQIMALVRTAEKQLSTRGADVTLLQTIESKLSSMFGTSTSEATESSIPAVKVAVASLRAVLEKVGSLPNSGGGLLDSNRADNRAVSTGSESPRRMLTGSLSALNFVDEIEPPTLQNFSRADDKDGVEYRAHERTDLVSSSSSGRAFDAISRAASRIRAVTTHTGEQKDGRDGSPSVDSSLSRGPIASSVEGELATARQISPALARSIAAFVRVQETLNILNGVMSSAGEPAFLIFPQLLEGILARVEVALHLPPQARGSRKRPENKGEDESLAQERKGKREIPKFRFKVQLAALGEVEVDFAEILGGALIKIKNGDPEITDFIAARSELLRQSLNDAAISVREIRAERATTDDIKPSWITNLVGLNRRSA